MKQLIAVLIVLACAGCGTYQKYSQYIPASPVNFGTGNVTLFKVLRLNGSVEIINPFSEAATLATNPAPTTISIPAGSTATVITQPIPIAPAETIPAAVSPPLPVPLQPEMPK